MPLSHKTRDLLMNCRDVRYTADDPFAPLRLKPDMKAYLDFADTALDEGWECARCGVTFTEGTEPYPKHRLTPWWGGSDTPENLIAVCRLCQGTFMREDNKAKPIWLAELARMRERGEDGWPPIPEQSYKDLPNRTKEKDKKRDKPKRPR